MKYNDVRDAAQNKVLLAAHRGIAGGNIPCNTLAAYEIALRQGADIVELDVSISADGKLFTFHPRMEPVHLRSQRYISDMTAKEVEELRFANQDGTVTEHPVNYLEDTLNFLKGRCYVNIDKFWTCMPEITALVRKLGMEDQVIVKTDADEKWFAMVEEIAPELPYMPIVSVVDTCMEQLLKRNIRYIGAEVLFKTDESATAQKAYWDKMHDNGLIVWANSIVYSYKAVLAGGHSDDISLTDDPGKGWGWLADNGCDIIQTDWVQMARQYLESTGRRNFR